MKRWSPEKQRQQRLPMARATRGGEPEGKGKADNNAGFQAAHESDIRRIWTTHDVGVVAGRLRYASPLHTAHLPIEMSKSPPQDLCPADNLTTNGHPTHVAGTHLQRKRTLVTAATKASRLIRRWAIMDQTGRQNLNGTQTGGGLVERLCLVDTPHCSEQGNKAVTPAPTFRPSEGSPPLGPKYSKRGSRTRGS